MRTTIGALLILGLLAAAGCSPTQETKDEVRDHIYQNTDAITKDLSQGNWLGALIGAITTAAGVGAIYVNGHFKNKERERVAVLVADKVKANGV